MPPKTRASVISSRAEEKLEKERVPGKMFEVAVKGVLSPKVLEKLRFVHDLIQSRRAEQKSESLRATG